MPAPSRKYRLGPHQRLALQLLAGIPFGATEAAMFVNFDRAMIADLVHEGFATVERELVTVLAVRL
jgi:hypothetical protein